MPEEFGGVSGSLGKNPPGWETVRWGFYIFSYSG